MSKKFYSIEDKADEADIMLYGVIGDSWLEESVTARQLVGEIKSLEKTHSRINVHINSAGGSVFDGLAIFNALQNSSAEVHTWNDGLAASMAAVILMAGSTVHSAKNALMMVHSPSTGVWGNAVDLRNALTTLEKVQNSLIQCMLSRTEKTKSEVEVEYFDCQDHWLSADEAQAEGFIDEIIEKKATISQKEAAREYKEMVAIFSNTITSDRRKGKLVAWIENLFTPVAEQQETFSKDMDIKTMQAALSLSDTATETDVLASINKLKSDYSASQAALAAAVAEKNTLTQDLTRLKAEKATIEQELEDLKKEPGAPPAAVDPNPEPVESEPKNFGEAFLSVMKTFKKR